MILDWLRAAGVWPERAGASVSPAAFEAGLEARRREMRSGYLVKPLAAVNFVLFYLALEGQAPNVERNAWALVIGPVTVAWVGLSAAYLVRRPDDGPFYRIWAPFSRLLTLGVAAGLAASAWFLRYADLTGNLYLVVIYVGFLALMAAAVTEGALRVVLCAVMVLGAAALQLHQLGETPLAIMIVIFGLVIGLIARSQERSFRRLIEARETTDRVAARLDAALSARDRFVAAVSHDLRQPLAALRLYLDQILREHPAGSPAGAAQGARGALEATDALLAHMLEHLRLQAGAQPAFMEPVPVTRIFARVMSLHAPAAMAAGMRLKMLPSRLSALGDPLLLERALGNLAANAVRHAMGERILLCARRRGKEVQLWVVDDGVGVEACDRAGLFDDFTQGSRHRAELRGGFGLGLANVRRIAALMGGTAGLSARWTGGAAFYLQLPLAKPSS